MELTNTSSINRINLDALEPRANNSALRQPPAAQPGLSTPPAAPANTGARAVALQPVTEIGASPLSRELSQILSDLRASLSESALSSGQEFRSANPSRVSSVALQQVDRAQEEPSSPSDATEFSRASVNAPAADAQMRAFTPFVADEAEATPDTRVTQADPRISATPTPAPAPESQEPNIGDATLASLSTSLNLQSAAGRFQIDVNGQTLNFRADQTLNDVLSGISAPGSGVRAALDPRERRIDIESTDGRPISITDRTGNLSSGLGIEVTPSENTNASLSRELQDFARGLNRAINTLENPDLAPRSEEADKILNELKSALNSLFSPSPNGQVNGMGDLGFSRRNGEVQFDEKRLNSLIERNAGEVNRVAESVTRNAAPILASGERVVRELETSLAQAKASTQEVRIFGEIQRLQVRQQTLELDRVSIDKLRQRVADQGEVLARLAESLESRMSGASAGAAQEAREFARDVANTRPRQRPPIAVRPPDPPLGNVTIPNSSFVLNRDLV